MNRHLLAAGLAALILALSLPAMAERGHHPSGRFGSDFHAPARYSQDFHHHQRHHRAPLRYGHRAHRVERHVFFAPPRDRHHRHHRHHRHDRHRHGGHRHHGVIPLVTVDGYPLLRIQVNH
ncbi:hypothetical protein [Halomonas maura]|uniref:hypothetical protein n=1 Tax=Halomonas maura TaxID=117606 RepID=UPI0025B378CD|nr:hypothetical protein [Halomonas maura]MDN3554577.1 hypothetical protein [Halomonas maura]